MTKFRYFIFAALLAVLSLDSRADTVFLKDGTRIQGVILDEYSDRVLVSTTEGEKSVLKDDIWKASYSDEIRSTLHKARNMVRRGKLTEAYSYYKKVSELDPGNIEADIRIEFLRKNIKNGVHDKVWDNIEMRTSALSGGRYDPAFAVKKERYKFFLSPGEPFVTVNAKVEDAEGIVFQPNRLTSGDRIISVWGAKTAYLSVEEIAGLLATNGDNKVVFERDVDVAMGNPLRGLSVFRFSGRYRAITGASLELNNKGVEVMKVDQGGPFSLAGIIPGDIISSVNGESIKYTPIKKVFQRIEAGAGSKTVFSIQRDITIWNK
ncbi:MAG: PDZ domain-containing protein [Candidatus Omnitrophica bacterium]|nr:PDZ domain-containing protein [Candidatus Omnitrophota bacterium]